MFDFKVFKRYDAIDCPSYLLVAHAFDFDQIDYSSISLNYFHSYPLQAIISFGKIDRLSISLEE